MAEGSAILQFKRQKELSSTVTQTKTESSSIRKFVEEKNGTTIPSLETPRTVDDARKIQKEDPTLWQKISKQLMKPVGAASTVVEDLGSAIGRREISELKNTPSKIGGIITGTREHSFSEVWQKNGEGLGLSPKTTAFMGFASDVLLDPLNVLSGGLTTVGRVTSKVEALNNARQAIKIGSKVDKELTALGLTADAVKLATTKADQARLGQRALLTFMAGTRFEKPLIQGAPIYEAFGKLAGGLKHTKPVEVINKVFNTKTSNDAFNLVQEHYQNLANYRRGEVMDEALDIQRKIGELGQEEAFKVINVIESGTKSGIKEIDEVALQLKNNFDKLAKQEKELGLLKTTIQDYFPHIKVKEKIGDKIISFFSSPKKYSTALGAKKHRKIEGTVQEINKMFGTEFFEQRPAIAYAQRALASAKATTSKEFFDSVKQFAVKEGDELFEGAVETTVKELEGMKFAPDIARQIDAYQKAIKPEELRTAFRLFDQAQNVWKAQALVAPSYHIRNFVGNMWNNYIAGIKNPLSYARAMKMQMGKPLDFVDGTGRKWNQLTLLRAAKQTGVIDEGWYAADIATGLADELGGNSWNPLRQNFGLYRANRKAGSALENNARLAHFIEKLDGGMSIDNAALSVKKYLFDYNDLTDTEKIIFKRLAPFYTWTRKNIPIQLEELFDKPLLSGVAAVGGAIEGARDEGSISGVIEGSIAGAAGVGSRKFAAVAKAQQAREMRVDKPNEKYLSEYIKNNVGIRVGTDADGNTLYFLMGNWLPAAQAIDFLSQPTDNFIMMVSPFIKTPIELWANKSSFFKNTLGEPESIERYPQENTSWLGFTMRKRTATILRNIRLLNEIDKWNPGAIFGDKDNPSLVNKMAPDFGVKLPGLGTITTSEQRGGRYSPDSTNFGRTLQALFGKTTPYDPNLSRKYYLWDTDTKLRELERAIKDANRDGQTEYAKRLREEWKEVRKERLGR